MMIQYYYYHQFYYFSSFNDSEYMKILYVNCSSRNKYESTPCSYDHFLSSSEIKAWKKFMPEWDLNPWPLWY